MSQFISGSWRYPRIELIPRFNNKFIDGQKGQAELISLAASVDEFMFLVDHTLSYVDTAWSSNVHTRILVKNYTHEKEFTCGSARHGAGDSIYRPNGIWRWPLEAMAYFLHKGTSIA